MSAVFVALVHHPVIDKRGDVITTALTSIDLHDMARSAKTYGVKRLFVVHPVTAQRELADKIKAHWVRGSGAVRIPSREAALALLETVPTLEDVFDTLGGRGAIDVYATAARIEGRSELDFATARRKIAEGRRSLILFGTGWGLAPSALESADFQLSPIRGVEGEYNHLSVRAACSIVLDRLLGSS